MRSNLSPRYATFVARRSGWAVLAVAVLTGVVAAGAVLGDRVAGDIGEVSMRSPAHEARDVIEATYASTQHIDSYIIVRDGDERLPGMAAVLRGLRFQAAITSHPEIAPTLVATDAVKGLESFVGRAACAMEAEKVADESGASLPWQEGARVAQADCDLHAQISAVERLAEAEFRALIAAVVDPATAPAGSNPRRFLPVGAEGEDVPRGPRAMLLSQRNPNSAPISMEEVRRAQLRIDAMLSDWFDGAFIHGEGVAKAESTRAVADSFRLITPIALVLLAVVLTLTLRDPWDIALTLLGVVVVVLWLQGLQGWLAIPSTSILIAVPFLLVGLGVDYALHVLMRYREAGETSAEGLADGIQGPAPRDAMTRGLLPVLPALGIAAVSTAIGFLANIFSPLESIRDFALISGLGILATLLVFTSFVPALKVLLETFLQKRGRARRRHALGRAPGLLNRLLLAAAYAGVRWPWRVSFLALVLAVAGFVAALGIDTSFKRTDFQPSKAPSWLRSLPAPLAPADYSVKDNFAYLLDHFGLIARPMEAEILLRGDVTSPEMLQAIEAVSLRATRNGTFVTASPAGLIRMAARSDADFAAALAERDDDGDGLPDRDVATLYDQLFTLSPDRAAEVLYRGEGVYQSARLPIGLLLNASVQDIATDISALASIIEERAPVRAVATGRPVLSAKVQSALFATLVEGFAITLIVIAALLAVLYGMRWHAPGVGPLLLLPVVVALACLLGLMRLLGIPFNSETVVITSLAIGIGVDYSVHIGERFLSARARVGGVSLHDAMQEVLTGTGGALLGSAVTTACGFGVLALATSPPLQRFGLVTGMSILLALLASVVLLPSLLVLRERWLSARAQVQ